MNIKMKLQSFLKYLNQIINSQFIKDNWKNIKPCNILLLAHDNDRSYYFGGLYYAHIIDTLSWYLCNSNYQLSIESIRLPFAIINKKGIYGSPKTINRSMLIAKLKDWLIAKLSLFRNINDEYELKLWFKIIELAKPQVVIAIQPHPLLCKACKIKQIKIFDYQHGLINEAMPEYGYEFGANALKEKLPSGYICWDNESAKVLKLWSDSKNVDVLVQGNPWVNRFLDHHSHDLLVSKEFDQLSNIIYKILNNHKYEKIILITLQPLLDKLYPENYLPNHFINQSLIDLLNSSNDDILWLIRLHPIQCMDQNLKNKIFKFFSKFKNVEIEYATKAALPAVLTYVNGHLTWNSCVVLEASYMGIQSFIMDPCNVAKQVNSKNEFLPFYEHIVQSKLAIRAKKTNCADEIKVWLKSLDDRKFNNNFIKFNVESFIKDLGVSMI